MAKVKKPKKLAQQLTYLMPAPEVVPEAISIQTPEHSVTVSGSDLASVHAVTAHLLKQLKRKRGRRKEVT